MNSTIHTVIGTAAQDGRIIAIESPINGLGPSFSFGGPFDTWWRSAFAAFWGLVIIGCLVFCLGSILKLRSTSDNPHAHKQGQEALKISSIALGLSVAFGVLVTVVFYIAG
ncbi:hypothetical protein [Cellulomonas sp. HD19AZ1]|uniref:hypothetical protein n=1 Tax=Cellulomonas sp. HD19AZ1 TaxID=2559593 RepID=UPI0010714756|nr:hypothetical protein [Cellulomonas sp. HD19AZ1]TFH68116.1 hypothetical protein E4A51_17890 [Cellulomonas sp. HD19AZ1]TFH68163.1 hypothetical protein E4A51_18130 [Cellulomonas sp. HD19AZ1]